MKVDKAKEQGYTHRAKMYGFIGYFREKDNGFVADWWLTDKLVELFLYLDITLNVNEEGFPIVLLYNL